MVAFTWLSLREQVMIYGQKKLYKDTEGLKNLLRRNQWRQESATKNDSKKYNGVKNPPRRNKARNHQWSKESAEKKYSKKY